MDCTPSVPRLCARLSSTAPEPVIFGPFDETAHPLRGGDRGNAGRAVVRVRQVAQGLDITERPGPGARLHGPEVRLQQRHHRIKTGDLA